MAESKNTIFCLVVVYYSTYVVVCGCYQFPAHFIRHDLDRSCQKIRNSVHSTVALVVYAQRSVLLTHSRVAFAVQY